MEMLDSDENIDIFIKDNKVAMLYFSSRRCSVCTVLLPKIEELLKRYQKIKLCKIDIDELQSATGRFSIFTLPCILLFIEGREIMREARFISINELEGKINRFYDLV